MSATEMTDTERLLHYVLGVVQGKIVTPYSDDPLRDAWAEYRRLGFDPLTEEWPVLTLSPPMPPNVTSTMRTSYEELRGWVEEHGMSPEAYSALAGMARVLGEQPPKRPGQQDRVKRPEEMTGEDVAELEPGEIFSETAAEGLCVRCRVLDDVAAPLTEKDGKPWCERCQTDGSGRQL